MFKVSLLPDSYRRHLENKVKVEMASKIALVVLICLTIVLGGVLVKGAILSSKYKHISEKNRQLEAQFPALQEYQMIYNDLLSSKTMIEGIIPKNTEAVKFLTMVSNITPDYVQVTEISLKDWFTAGICTLTCTVQDYKDVKDYKALFETEEMKATIQQAQITSIERTITSDGNKSCKFTLALTMTNSVPLVTKAPEYNGAEETKSEETSKENDQKESSTKAEDKEKETKTTKATDTTKADDTTTTTKKGD